MIFKGSTKELPTGTKVVSDNCPLKTDQDSSTNSH